MRLFEHAMGSGLGNPGAGVGKLNMRNGRLLGHVWPSARMDTPHHKITKVCRALPRRASKGEQIAD